MRIGRVEITDVEEDGRQSRPFSFTVRTYDGKGDIILVDTPRFYQHETARRERVAKITQLQSARTKRRKRAPR